jgi:hypothetical protein
MDEVISRYVILQSEASDELPSQHDNYLALKQFGLKIRDRLEKIDTPPESPRFASIESVSRSQRMQLVVLNSFLSEAQEHLNSQLRDSVSSALDVTDSLMEFLSTNADYTSDSATFIADIEHKIESNPKHVRARFMRDALQFKVIYIARHFPVPDYAKLARDILNRCFFKMDTDQLYAKPSPFDSILPYYIETSELKCMVNPTAMGIVHGSVEGSLAAIASFADLISEQLISGPERSGTVICYCALVRFLFDEAYVLGGELNRFGPENATFLTRCELVKNYSIHRLTLPDRIKANYTPKMLLDSLFRPKQLRVFASLGRLTNPADLLYKLHQGYLSIAKHFTGDNDPLTFDETTTILMGVLAVNPIPNIIALARFLKKWMTLSLVQGADDTVELFIAAVERILPLNGGGEDEEESYEEEL